MLVLIRSQVEAGEPRSNIAGRSHISAFIKLLKMQLTLVMLTSRRTIYLIPGVGDINPKHLSVRMDRETGEIWLTEEKYMQPPKRIKKITSDVILALAADIVAVEDTRSAVRDIKFSDGTHVRLLVQDLSQGDPEQETFTAGFLAGQGSTDAEAAWEAHKQAHKGVDGQASGS